MTDSLPMPPLTEAEQAQVCKHLKESGFRAQEIAERTDLAIEKVEEYLK